MELVSLSLSLSLRSVCADSEDDVTTDVNYDQDFACPSARSSGGKRRLSFAPTLVGWSPR